jgi:hypothetical protein
MGGEGEEDAGAEGGATQSSATPHSAPPSRPLRSDTSLLPPLAACAAFAASCRRDSAASAAAVGEAETRGPVGGDSHGCCGGGDCMRGSSVSAPVCRIMPAGALE